MAEQHNRLIITFASGRQFAIDSIGRGQLRGQVRLLKKCQKLKANFEVTDKDGALLARGQPMAWTVEAVND